MAIIIPSKNIYEINNPKIRDNLVDNVSIKTNIVKPNNEFDVSVYNKSFVIGTTVLNEKLSQEDIYGGVGDNRYWQRGCFVGIETKTISFEVFVPKTNGNLVIQELFYGLDKEEKPKIKTRLICEKKTGTKIITLNSKDFFTVMQEENYNIVFDDAFYITSETINVESITDEELNVEENQTGIASNPAVKAKVVAKNVNNLGEENALVEKTDMGYKFNFTILCGYEKYYGKQTEEVGENDMYSFINNEQVVYCNAELVIPQQIELTFYGNTIGIDLTDGSVKVGSGNKPHSLSGNELLQDSGKVGNIPLTEHLAKNVLNQYSKGKETATILCSISDYYAQPEDTLINLNGYNFEYYQTKRLSTLEGVTDNFFANGYELNFNFQESDIENIIEPYVDIVVSIPKREGLESTIIDLATVGLNLKWSENPVVLKENEYKKIVRLSANNVETIKDFVRENYGALFYITFVRYYLYYDGDITEYQINLLDKNGNVVKNIYSQSLSKATKIIKDIYIEDNSYHLEFVSTLFYLSSTKCVATWDVSSLVGQTITLDIDIQNIANGTLRFFAKILSISTSTKNLPMSFRLHDEVIPMIFGANGEDVPMSRKQDGSPKVFEVVGSNIIYDGAVWQELTLQEKN